MERTLWQRAKHSPNMALLLFSLPFLIMFLTFFIYPFCVGVVMSFTNTNGFTPKYDFVGLSNYVKLFTNDARFYTSLGLTFLFGFSSVLIGNVLALFLAFVVESGIKFKNTFRTLFFVPYMFALVIIGFVWRFIYIQYIPQLGSMLGWDFLKQGYISDPKIAIWSVVGMQVWYNLGYYMAIYIAGIQAIDTSMIEAARVDGANTWTLYTKIMIPMMMPSISVCMFTGFASAFKAFDSVLALTGGGPGFATEVLALNIYYEAMGDAQRYGYGMAKAMVLAGVILVITMVQLRFFKSREVEV